MDNLSQTQLRELYYYMKLTRSLEERLEFLFKQGKIVGGLYSSLGQEAESIAAAYALEDGDWLAPGIRNLGALLVRGVSPKEMLLQYMAKADGPCRGKDTTTHFTDPVRGLVGPISPLGTMICVMSGVALSFKLRREPQVALTFIGEGATRTGAAHEGTNLAAVQGSPLVLIAEDNGWAFATRTHEEVANTNLVDMAEGYGVPGVQVDGNDALAVYAAAKEAVDRARGGGGMSIIEVKTYRMKGHAQHDAQKYVPPEELELWRTRDPIDRYISYLTAESLATESEIAELDKRIEAELDQAVSEAEASPMPDPVSALSGTYADAPPAELWAREL